MKQKIFYTLALCLPAICASAQSTQDTLTNHILFSDEQLIVPLTPTYLEDVTEAANWGRNWFIDLKGGASAFLGSPIGCSDVFGRLQPVLQAGLGKWFTPAVGGRVVYQGMRLKDSQITTQKYNNVHADFLYNVTNRLNRDEHGLARWDCIPYVGLGLIQHVESGRKPLAVHYGVMARYRLSKRFHLAAELGALTTFRDFDGYGAGNKLGDNMLNLTVGITYTIGKVGWKKVVDARPYMSQNEWLNEYVSALQKRNHLLAKQCQDDRIALAEYRKILEIEGLLNQYRDRLPEANRPKSLYPRNDYSGLNSLRARLANRKWNGLSGTTACDTLSSHDSAQTGQILVHKIDSVLIVPKESNSSLEDYLKAINSGRTGIGAPVYFFFELGTDQLTDQSQIINLDEIARLAKIYNLKVKITGAADSATGNTTINNYLSKERADYLAEKLQSMGVKKNNISTFYEGGINRFTPIRANRNSSVILSL